VVAVHTHNLPPADIPSSCPARAVAAAVRQEISNPVARSFGGCAASRPAHSVARKAGDKVTSLHRVLVAEQGGRGRRPYRQPPGSRHRPTVARSPPLPASRLPVAPTGSRAKLANRHALSRPHGQEARRGASGRTACEATVRQAELRVAGQARAPAPSSTDRSAAARPVVHRAKCPVPQRVEADSVGGRS
jgi:hypothetical protein